MESLTASRDPVLQSAARIAGFDGAMVQDNGDGERVVLCRHRFSSRWEPFGHLEPGECALNAFYGTAFWERGDVLDMFGKQEEAKALSLLSTKSDISKDFLSDLAKKIASRVEGKHELLEALARHGRAHL